MTMTISRKKETMNLIYENEIFCVSFIKFMVKSFVREKIYSREDHKI